MKYFIIVVMLMFIAIALGLPPMNHCLSLWCLTRQSLLGLSYMMPGYLPNGASGLTVHGAWTTNNVTNVTMQWRLTLSVNDAEPYFRSTSASHLLYSAFRKWLTRSLVNDIRIMLWNHN